MTENKKKKLKFWHKVLLGMALGMVFGYFFPDLGVNLKDIGTLFINMIRMVVIPLIFFAILYGITSVDDVETFTRLGKRALMIYSLSTVIAVTLGLILANTFKPGIGLQIDFTGHSDSVISNVHHTANKGLKHVLLNMVPSNPIAAMAEGNTVQVVLFALFTGFALILIGERGRAVKDLVGSAANLVFKMVELVIRFTPYGVFALMSWIVAEYGLEVVVGLTKFVAVSVSAFAIQYCVSGMMILLLGRLNPLYFYRKMVEVYALAFATSSTKATLVTAMSTLNKRLGVSKQSSSFILPLGASMNMDATAIYLGVCAVFLAQIVGVELTLSQYFVIIVTATIGAIGAAGVPSGGIIMLGLVLSSVGLPLEGISLIIGVDRFLDMIRTVINVNGDCAVTVIVDKMEGTLNVAQYKKLPKKDTE